MKNTLDTFVGSYSLSSQQQLYANAMASCQEILTLDADGRMFRQYLTSNYVFKEGGAKEVYNINVTLVGRYQLKGGMLSFSETLPRLDGNSFDFYPGPSDKEVDEPAVKRACCAKLESKIAEVLMNRGLECRQINTGRFPACQAYLDGDTLVLKYLKNKGVVKMTRCETPAGLDRKRQPVTLEEALKAPETRFVNALITGDNDYLNHATLYVPCKRETDKNEISFTPLELDDRKFMLVFSDIHRMKSCSMVDSTSWRPAFLPELASFSPAFNGGVCLNPSRGNTIGIDAEMLNQIVDYKWEGLKGDENESKQGL